MFAYFLRRPLIVPIAPALGGTIGLAFALAIALMPGTALDALVSATGIPAVLPAAAPPLGGTARAVLVLFGGGGIALLTGIAAYLLAGRRALVFRSVGAENQLGEAVPMLRRADAHPDAPARAPVLATRDLGIPLLDVPVAPASGIERTLPANLDQPLARYDPAAIPDSPREPVRPVTPLVRFDRPQLIDPGDRFETFALTPMARDPSNNDLSDSGEPSATIHALLDRLERGVTRQDRKPSVPMRAAPQAADGLQQALGTLRRLAAGA